MSTVGSEPFTVNPVRPLRLRAHAKINLTLHVTGRRPDGYHDLVSWVALVGLHDTIELAEADARGVELQCDAPDIPTDERNLVVRAVRAMEREFGREAALRISLTKRIPAGAGLGGGSSDAAATLRAIDRLWGTAAGAERLSRIAAGLGSDVPLFLGGGQSVIRGRGEQVEAVLHPWHGWVVLVMPPFGVSTPAVYGTLRLGGARRNPEAGGERGAASGDVSAAELGGRLFNDLQGPAFAVEPRLAALHGRLSELGQSPVHMSGSGSTLFSIFDDRESAERWRARVDGARLPGVRTVCCETIGANGGLGEGVEHHGDY